jgi:biopolymer transport protein ExbD
MRRRLFHHAASGAPKINVTPLIDVVMVLIIFFLIVGRLASEHGAKVKVPDSSSGKVESDLNKVIVNVASVNPGETVVIIDGISLTMSQLEEFLTRRRVSQPGSQVLLRADRVLKYGEVEPVIAVCRKVGFSSIRLVTERKGNDS